ncbi:hypothetical protein GWI33_013866 [Rhynchophorus ferrugineus]|uniref:Uncharacterized protein n=1 Tax=Rhynchophorus ferrugineus TaxID=354439 RepID=A0A834I2W8_RHYFE|nr:hypothetical protein GWI33_013866 [Rhynchophorus ferrugineus]
MHDRNFGLTAKLEVLAKVQNGSVRCFWSSTFRNSSRRRHRCHSAEVFAPILKFTSMKFSLEIENRSYIDCYRWEWKMVHVLSKQRITWLLNSRDCYGILLPDGINLTSEVTTNLTVE